MIIDLKTVLKPKTARINTDNLKSLEKFVRSENNPKFFFTMTEINKVGINPRSTYSTPLGAYCYPLTPEYYKKLIDNSLPFAGNKPYVNLFTLSVPTNNMDNYSEANLKVDLARLKQIYEEVSDQQMENIMDKATEQTPMWRLWNLTRVLSGTAKKWNFLLRKLGYTNFYDQGQGIIYSEEPAQMVVLDPSVIIQIETFHNPHAEEIDLPHIDKRDKKILEQKNKQRDSLANYVLKLIDPEALKRIAMANIDNMLLIENVIYNSNTDSSTLNFIFKHIRNNVVDKNYFTQVLLKNPNTSISILEEMANEPDRYILDPIEMKLFVKIASPELLMDAFEYSKNLTFKKAILDSNKCPKEIFYIALRDENLQIILASSNYCPVDILERLANSDDANVRLKVVLNANTPGNILDILADENQNDGATDFEYITRAIVNNLNVLPETLIKISNTTDSKDVRGLLVKNPLTPPQALINIANNIGYDYITASKLLNSSKITIDIVKSLLNGVSIIRSTVANSSIVRDIEIAELVALDPSPEIRKVLASNKKCPISVLEKLKIDSDSGVADFARKTLGNKNNSKMSDEDVTFYKDQFKPVSTTASIMNNDLIKISKDKKLSIDQIKSISPVNLLKIINKSKKILLKDKVFLKMCKENNFDPKMIHLIPIRFGDLDVSARTSKGIITLNYSLLCDKKISTLLSYEIHEIGHYISMTTTPNGTSSGDEDYLDNPEEVKSFQYQIEHINNLFGDSASNKYVNQLLDHHDVEDKHERKEKKEELLENVNEEK